MEVPLCRMGREETVFFIFYFLLFVKITQKFVSILYVCNYPILSYDLESIYKASHKLQTIINIEIKYEYFLREVSVTVLHVRGNRLENTL